MAEIGLTTRKPGPPRADFAILIDFDRDAERPERVFQAAERLISALSRLDKALASAIDSAIEPVLMLEDIEAGSLKIWLRDKIKHVEDQALYELDWKPLVGKYLLAAKYAFVQWVSDEEERVKPGSIRDLRKNLFELAVKTDVRKIPVYSAPDTAALISSAEEFASALEPLGERDRVRYLSSEGDHDFDMSLSWGELSLSDLAIKETLVAPPAPMILAVRRPDYLGATQWEFRHGKRTIRARITDEEWLAGFQARRIDVRPGDALRCLTAVEVSYGYDNEVISESYEIKKVLDVLENELRQDRLFDD